MKTFKKVTLLMSYRILLFQEMQFGEHWASQIMLSIQSTDHVLSALYDVLWLAVDNRSHLQAIWFPKS